jgi:hypothetical protein
MNGCMGLGSTKPTSANKDRIDCHYHTINSLYCNIVPNERRPSRAAVGFH